MEKWQATSERLRRVLMIQAWATLVLTLVIAVSTALYTVAAWRQAPQPQQVLGAGAASSTQHLRASP
jgi:hypothetical protein